MGGRDASLCLLTRRHVMRVGAVHLRGGMMMRMPLWRLPRMEPPRASTMKLTKNLWKDNDPIREDKERFSILQALRDELSHAVTKTHSNKFKRENQRRSDLESFHAPDEKLVRYTRLVGYLAIVLTKTVTISLQ